jgi:hypothetical protein
MWDRAAIPQCHFLWAVFIGTAVPYAIVVAGEPSGLAANPIRMGMMVQPGTAVQLRQVRFP